MTNPAQADTHRNRGQRLLAMLSTNDTLGIAIVADPDAIASALALKMLCWHKVKKTVLCRVNTITRSDNLAMIRCLHVELPYIKQIDSTAISKWAMVDSQPHHHRALAHLDCSILIDHHSPRPELNIPFMDVREDYGATSSIMTEYLRATNITPSAQLATALFYGIKTDTGNFTRTSTDADIKAFRYLYPYVNLKIIKKIESSEINKKNLAAFRQAFDHLQLIDDTAYIHMGEVKETDVLVILADFFLKMVEASWCMVSGIYGQKIIIIIRNASFRLDAGKVAARLFGAEGSAGGHQNTARAEIPVAVFKEKIGNLEKISAYITAKIKSR